VKVRVRVVHEVVVTDDALHCSTQCFWREHWSGAGYSTCRLFRTKKDHQPRQLKMDEVGALRCQHCMEGTN
jgi:hypothetical protein